MKELLRSSRPLAVTFILVCFIVASASVCLAGPELSIGLVEVDITSDVGPMFHVQNTSVDHPSNVFLGGFLFAFPFTTFGVRAEISGGHALSGVDYSDGVGVYGSSTSGWAGKFDGNVYIDGNIDTTGSITKAAVAFAQPHPSDPSKEIVYAAVEGPEHAVFYRGTAKLKHGRAVIETPEYFRIVAGNEGITVNFTPRSEKSKGLAAVSVKKDRVEVRELMKGKGNYEFDYFITAKRSGFEAHKPIQENTHFSADKISVAEFEKRYARSGDMAVTAMRNLLISNGILNSDGKLNLETASRLGWLVRDGEVATVK